MTRPGPGRTALTAVLVPAAVLLAAACGSGASSPSSTRHPTGAAAPPRTASPAPALTACQGVDSLRAALHSLTTVKITQGADSEIKAVARGIQASVSELSGAARAEWGTQIDDLKSALTRLQSAAGHGSASPAAHQPTLRAAAADVGAAGRRLLAAMGNRCPSPSPSR